MCKAKNVVQRQNFSNGFCDACDMGKRPYAYCQRSNDTQLLVNGSMLIVGPVKFQSGGSPNRRAMADGLCGSKVDAVKENFSTSTRGDFYLYPQLISSRCKNAIPDSESSFVALFDLRLLH